MARIEGGIIEDDKIVAQHFSRGPRHLMSFRVAFDGNPRETVYIASLNEERTGTDIFVAQLPSWVLREQGLQRSTERFGQAKVTTLEEHSPPFVKALPDGSQFYFRHTEESEPVAPVLRTSPRRSQGN